MEHESTQGIIITSIDDNTLEVVLGWLTIPVDIKLCTAILKAATKLWPDCTIRQNDEPESYDPWQETEAKEKELWDIQAGDRIYVMLKLGDTTGILAKGMFISGAYDMADETGKRYRYAQVQLGDLGNIERPPLSLADLEDAIPENDWSKPHLNLRLSKKVAKKLSNLWEQL